MHIKGSKLEAYLEYEKISKHEPLPSVNYMASLIISGHIKDKSFDDAKDLLKPYLELDGYSALLLFDINYLQGNCHEALRCLEKAKKLSFCVAYYRLGQIYNFGNCVKKSSYKALCYYKRGSQLGHVWSRIYYSKLLLKGRLGYRYIPAGLITLLFSVVYALYLVVLDPRSNKFIE